VQYKSKIKENVKLKIKKNETIFLFDLCIPIKQIKKIVSFLCLKINHSR